MTVKELIEELKTYPQDMTVYGAEIPNSSYVATPAVVAYIKDGIFIEADWSGRPDF